MSLTGDLARPEPAAVSPGPAGAPAVLLGALRYPFTGPGPAVMAVLALLGATLWTDRIAGLISLYFMAQAARVARGGALGMPSLPRRDEVRDAVGLWGRAVGAVIILVAPVWLFLAVLYLQEYGWNLELPGVDLAGDLGITGLVVAPFWILFWTPIVVAALALGDSVLFVYLPGRLLRVYRDLGNWAFHVVGATWLGGIATVAIASAVLPKAGIVNDVGSRAQRRASRADDATRRPGARPPGPFPEKKKGGRKAALRVSRWAARVRAGASSP